MLSALIVSKPGLVEDVNKKIKDDCGESDNRGIRTLASKDWMGD